MKVTINPKYEKARAAIEQVLKGTYTPTHTYCNQRNIVEKIEIDGKPYVLKKFKPTGLLNGIIYTFFRKSKAHRAYEHAEFLLANGIDTAIPVAYAENRRCGIFRSGYFLSEFIDAPLVSDIYDPDFPADGKKRLCMFIAKFIFDMHQKGIMPLDLNPGNIFYRNLNGRPVFALIDINRMKTGKIPTMSQAMRAFFQLGVSAWNLTDILPHYMWHSGYDFNESAYHVLRWRHKWKRNCRLKQRMRKLLHM